MSKPNPPTRRSMFSLRRVCLCVLVLVVVAWIWSRLRNNGLNQGLNGYGVIVRVVPSPDHELEARVVSWKPALAIHDPNMRVYLATANQWHVGKLAFVSWEADDIDVVWHDDTNLELSDAQVGQVEDPIPDVEFNIGSRTVLVHRRSMYRAFENSRIVDQE
jgi:hypothetical protein